MPEKVRITIRIVVEMPAPVTDRGWLGRMQEVEQYWERKLGKMKEIVEINVEEVQDA